VLALSTPTGLGRLQDMIVHHKCIQVTIICLQAPGHNEQPMQVLSNTVMDTTESAHATDERLQEAAGRIQTLEERVGATGTLLGEQQMELLARVAELQAATEQSDTNNKQGEASTAFLPTADPTPVVLHG
jgi:hypothetical protein